MDPSIRVARSGAASLRLAIIVSALFMLTGLAGCRAFLPAPDPPEVRVTTFTIERLGILEQTYRIGLDVRNPNPYALNVAELRFTLSLEGMELAEGIGIDDIRLPARGTSAVEVRLATDAARTLAVVAGWLAGDREAFDYGVQGEATLAGWGIRVPFDNRGRVDLVRE